jgi:hypothetical protein
LATVNRVAPSFGATPHFRHSQTAGATSESESVVASSLSSLPQVRPSSFLPRHRHSVIMFRATPRCRSAGQHRINCLRFFSFLSCSLVERKAQQAATHPTNLRQVEAKTGRATQPAIQTVGWIRPRDRFLPFSFLNCLVFV